MLVVENRVTRKSNMREIAQWVNAQSAVMCVYIVGHVLQSKRNSSINALAAESKLHLFNVMRG